MNTRENFRSISFTTFVCVTTWTGSIIISIVVILGKFLINEHTVKQNYS